VGIGVPVTGDGLPLGGLLAIRRANHGIPLKRLNAESHPRTLKGP